MSKKLPAWGAFGLRQPGGGGPAEFNLRPS